jgi:hypothetical protein
VSTCSPTIKATSTATKRLTCGWPSLFTIRLSGPTCRRPKKSSRRKAALSAFMPNGHIIKINLRNRLRRNAIGDRIKV